MIIVLKKHILTATRVQHKGRQNKKGNKDTHKI